MSSVVRAPSRWGLTKSTYTKQELNAKAMEEQCWVAYSGSCQLLSLHSPGQQAKGMVPPMVGLLISISKIEIISHRSAKLIQVAADLGLFSWAHLGCVELARLTSTAWETW